MYAVQFEINGEAKTVVVDDYFPYDEERNRWAFSQPSKGNEIWVLILEKAWAKVFGSYTIIEAGDPGEAMAPLTACPTRTVVLSDYPDKNHLWKFLKWADVKTFPMVCSAVSAEKSESVESYKRNGI